jgi:hypothetical protein
MEDRKTIFYASVRASLKGLFSKYLILLCCCFLLRHGASAQIIESVMVDTTGQVAEEEVTEAEEVYVERPYTPPPVKPMAMRAVDKGKWDDATNGLDYSKDNPKPVKERKPTNTFNPDWNASTAGIGQILQILAILLAIAAIGYGIYRTMQAPRNRRIGQAQDGTIITPENVDAYIHETDLERFLREALEAGNYPLGIRLYYLQTIKLLSEKEAILWSRAKTNRDYLREMRDHPLGREFREATRTFERVWYGNEPLDAAGFALLEPDFKNLLTKIN